MPCGLIVRDADEGIILEVNDYALDLFGVQRFSIVGQSLNKISLSMETGDENSFQHLDSHPWEALPIPAAFPYRF